jgi:hypothetical protein
MIIGIEINLTIRIKRLHKFKGKHACAIGLLVMLIFILTNTFALIEFPLNQIGNTTEIYACQSSKQYKAWLTVRLFFR